MSKLSQRIRLWTAIVIAAAVLGGSGCGKAPDVAPANSQRAAGDGRYTIVTTCGMVTDIVRQVAGDRAEVKGLMGAAVDPHLYKPDRSGVQQLMAADVVFYVGLALEGRMTDLFAKVGRADKPVYAVTEGIDESFLREPPEFAGHYDPHLWMDVSAWSQCVAFVAEALSEYDPAGAEYYQENAAEYREQLEELDAYAKRAIGSIPKDQRVLVTAHDAFGYFGRAYELEVRSVQGLSTESEASLDDINQLVDFMTENKIRAIFVESSVPEKNIEAIVEGARHKGWELAVGGVLFSDAMGPEGSYEGTYIGMIDHNVTKIAQALGGEVPSRGWQGKLREE